MATVLPCRTVKIVVACNSNLDKRFSPSFWNLISIAAAQPICHGWVVATVAKTILSVVRDKNRGSCFSDLWPIRMNESADNRLPRSPLLMNQDDSALLVVDVQKKLLPLIPDEARMRWNIRRLIDGAEALEVAIAATEQYPQGLGGHQR